MQKIWAKMARYVDIISRTHRTFRFDPRWVAQKMKDYNISVKSDEPKINGFWFEKRKNTKFFSLYDEIVRRMHCTYSFIYSSSLVRSKVIPLDCCDHICRVVNVNESIFNYSRKIDQVYKQRIGVFVYKRMETHLQIKLNQKRDRKKI